MTAWLALALLQAEVKWSWTAGGEGPRVQVTVEGRVSLPDGTILDLSLRRIGPSGEPEAVLVEVRKSIFRATMKAYASGLHRVTARLVPGLQKKKGQEPFECGFELFVGNPASVEADLARLEAAFRRIEAAAGLKATATELERAAQSTSLPVSCLKAAEFCRRQADQASAHRARPSREFPAELAGNDEEPAPPDRGPPAPSGQSPAVPDLSGLRRCAHREAALFLLAYWRMNPDDSKSVRDIHDRLGRAQSGFLQETLELETLLKGSSEMDRPQLLGKIAALLARMSGP
jgi:hypothetical protein